MKTTFFLLCFIPIVAVAGQGVSGGGSAPAATTPATTPGQTPVAPPYSAAGSQPVAGATNSPYSPAISNDTDMSNETNQFQGSNNFGANGGFGANGNQRQPNFRFEDRTVTDNDRFLLTPLRRKVELSLGITSPATEIPVHFIIDNGVVTLVGILPNAQDCQRVFLLTQQTPGVARVVNNLQVGTMPVNAIQPKAHFIGVTRDHALSAADQKLLVAAQQDAAAQLGIGSPQNGSLPVHFSIRDGVVGVYGQVSTFQQKQAIVAAIQRTPGVVRVVDNISVMGGPANGLAPNGGFVNSNLPPTSIPGRSNSFFLNTTNSSGITP
jgi:hypothetical protein